MSEQLFRCACKHYGFLEVIDFEDGELCVAFIDEPQTLWEWIKRCFRKRNYINEIILNKKDIKRLTKLLCGRKND